MADLTNPRTGLHPFKNFSLSWWQGAIYKWGMLALGLAVGAEWHGFFGQYLIVLAVIAVLCLCYVSYVWWKQ